VAADRLQAAKLDQRSLTAAQMKARPEGLFGDGVKPLVDRVGR
jgi:hypothetical protein